MSRILDVYLREDKAGILEQLDDGRLKYSYDVAYLTDVNPYISISMPLREEAYSDEISRPFFSGLLPDEQARKKLASALGKTWENAFSLLEEIGGECAGALSLLPQGSLPPDYTSNETEPLNNKRLAELLDILRVRPLLGGEQGVRMSLAGAQDKLAVCFNDGIVSLPKEGRPTTHILKPYNETLEGTVQNELFCMKLAAKMGFDVPNVTMFSVKNADYYLVERYDREVSEVGKITKLHQEDFCQALSILPEMKYEEEGGPGITQGQDLISDTTRKPGADRLIFQRMIMFNYLVGNAGAHAKNFSLLYRDNIPDLAPMYDVLSTALYPGLSQKMAMQIGERKIPDTIRFIDWLSLVPNTKVAARVLKKELFGMCSKIGYQADALIQEIDDNEGYHEIYNVIRKIISTRVGLVQRILDREM